MRANRVVTLLLTNEIVGAEPCAGSSELYRRSEFISHPCLRKRREPVDMSNKTDKPEGNRFICMFLIKTHIL